jgi:hypothetical protein
VEVGIPLYTAGKCSSLPPPPPIPPHSCALHQYSAIKRFKKLLQQIEEHRSLSSLLPLIPACPSSHLRFFTCSLPLIICLPATTATKALNPRQSPSPAFRLKLESTQNSLYAPNRSRQFSSLTRKASEFSQSTPHQKCRLSSSRSALTGCSCQVLFVQRAPDSPCPTVTLQPAPRLGHPPYPPKLNLLSQPFLSANSSASCTLR